MSRSHLLPLVVAIAQVLTVSSLARAQNLGRELGLQSHLQDGDEFNLSALRMLLLGALNWSPEWYDPSGLSPDQLVQQLTAMMESGVMPASKRR